MDYESLEKQIIRKQNLYILQLEEQLAVYGEKDRAQELLIKELNHALQLFADGVFDKKAGERERTGRMNAQQYFQSTSLSYRLKAAERELEAFRSGEAYVKLRAEYEGVIRSQNAAIKKLHKERDSFSFSRKEITRQWMDVLEDVQKEHEKEVKKLKKTIAELLDMIVSLKNRNAELDSKRKKALEDSYETAVKLEDAQGIILKLTAR